MSNVPIEFDNHTNLQGSQTFVHLFFLLLEFDNHTNLQGSQTYSAPTWLIIESLTIILIYKVLKPQIRDYRRTYPFGYGVILVCLFIIHLSESTMQTSSLDNNLRSTDSISNNCILL